MRRAPRSPLAMGMCAVALAAGLLVLRAGPAAAHDSDFGHGSVTISPTGGVPGTRISATYVYHPRRGDSCPSGTVTFFWNGSPQRNSTMIFETCSASVQISVPAGTRSGDYQVCGSAPPYPSCAVFSVPASSAPLPAVESGRPPEGDALWRTGVLLTTAVVGLFGSVFAFARFSQIGRLRRDGLRTHHGNATRMFPPVS
jgi:hypothetical protein